MEQTPRESSGIQFIDDGLDSGPVLAGTTGAICTELVKYDTFPQASIHDNTTTMALLFMFSKATANNSHHDLLLSHHCKIILICEQNILEEVI